MEQKHPDGLIVELGNLKKLSDGRGYRAEFTVSLLFWLAIIGSVGATIMGFTPAPKAMISIMAALPTAVILVQRQSKVGERAVWHNTFANELEALRLRLVHEGVSEAQVSEELRALNKRMHESYPKFDFSFVGTRR